jgi:hypothetical protein
MLGVGVPDVDDVVVVGVAEPQGGGDRSAIGFLTPHAEVADPGMALLEGSHLLGEDLHSIRSMSVDGAPSLPSCPLLQPMGIRFRQTLPGEVICRTLRAAKIMR